jgi:hypothetical protein
MSFLLKKRILIVSDSLALPRMEPEVVEYEQTWPFLLKMAFPDCCFHQLSIGGATVRLLKNQLSYLEKFNPDVVIVQSGIVDCTPRALTSLESDFINNFGITYNLGKIVLPKITNQLRKYRHICYTPEPFFKEAVESIKKTYDNVALFWLEILPASDAYEAKIPRVKKQVIRYNEILNSLLGAKVVAMDQFPSNGIMSDFHHLNVTGHLYVYGILHERIKGIIS